MVVNSCGVEASASTPLVYVRLTVTMHEPTIFGRLSSSSLPLKTNGATVAEKPSICYAQRSLAVRAGTKAIASLASADPDGLDH